MKKDNKYNVIIVGAGPSGIATAIILQKNGIKCLVIDKAKFPREKLCGGLLTKKAYDLILDLVDGDENIIKTATREVLNKVAIANNNEVLNSSEIDIPIRIIDRKILDNNLVEYYKSIGGEIAEGLTFKSYDAKNHTVIFDSNTYKCNYFVKAIGASSKSKNSEIGFCIESFIDKNDVNLPDDTIRIDFGIINKGYSWIFPFGDSYKIGYGNKYNKDFDYRKSFIEYLNKLKVKNIEKYEIKGAFVPYGRCEHKHIIDDFCILLGDQAGMTDPLYGEGLYFSFKTGMILASSIIKSIKNNIPLDYEKFINADKKQVNNGHIIKNIFFNKFSQRIFSYFVKRNKNLIKFYVDNQVSQYKYKHNDLFGLFFGFMKNMR